MAQTNGGTRKMDGMLGGAAEAGRNGGKSMANKDAILEALEEIENGMCRIKEWRSIWQNSLIYALCQAVRLLLIDKIKEKRR